MPHFVYAIVLVLATSVIHATCTVLVLGWLHSIRPDHWILGSATARAVLHAVVVLLMAVVAYAESALWALVFWLQGALPDLDDALYFSLVTYTTLGYGDVTLGEEWRTLAAVEAANGVLMFGWTTAIIVAIGQRLYSRRGEP